MGCGEMTNYSERWIRGKKIEIAWGGVRSDSKKWSVGLEEGRGGVYNSIGWGWRECRGAVMLFSSLVLRGLRGTVRGRVESKGTEE